MTEKQQLAMHEMIFEILHVGCTAAKASEIESVITEWLSNGDLKIATIALTHDRVPTPLCGCALRSFVAGAYAVAYCAKMQEVKQLNEMFGKENKDV